MISRLAIPLLILVAACGTPTEPVDLLPVGWWTGDTLVQVTDADATVFVTCGTGSFPRPMLDRSGNFKSDGTLKISVGPPPPVPSPGAPATFSGHLNGSTLTLTIASLRINHTWTLRYDGTASRQAPPTFCP